MMKVYFNAYQIRIFFLLINTMIEIRCVKTLYARTKC